MRLLSTAISALCAALPGPRRVVEQLQPKRTHEVWRDGCYSAARTLACEAGVTRSRFDPTKALRYALAGEAAKFIVTGIDRRDEPGQGEAQFQVALTLLAWPEIRALLDAAFAFKRAHVAAASVDSPAYLAARDDLLKTIDAYSARVR